MGRVRNKKGQILHIYNGKDGYCYLKLYYKGKGKKQYIHRLVYEAFNGPIPKDLFCNHISEIKSDNSVENINLMTRKENNNWGTRNERTKQTLTNRLDLSKKIICVETGQIYESIQEAERQTNIKHSTICQCCQNKYGHKTAGGFHWKYAD